MSQENKDTIEEMVLRLSNHYTKIIPTDELKQYTTIKKYASLCRLGNGVGDRWANTKFNYTSIYSKTHKLYSENDHEEIPPALLAEFREKHAGNGIIGIFVHSKRTHIVSRLIHKKIHKQITAMPCVVCGTGKTVCDHKNDLYNDPRVLEKKTQQLSDFQPLCQHCNLQKRQVCKTEHATGRIYSAKQIAIYRVYDFEFPWEKKAFDKKDITCKDDTYWFDPVAFHQKINDYMTYRLPIIRAIKRKFFASTTDASKRIR